ncbi:MAG: hypothetical protein D3924_00155 [Candidatus Electrothrix sp. AR4]|nr:hypothetical protein [Candidatus Electrothrix sp. AR4]
MSESNFFSPQASGAFAMKKTTNKKRFNRRRFLSIFALLGLPEPFGFSLFSLKMLACMPSEKVSP